MKDKQDIIQNKHIASLLAWCRFLTYKELEATDNLEVYDVLVQRGTIKSVADWNKLVIPYTEDNIKKALCIALYNAYWYIQDDSNIISINVDDIKNWLYILDDNTLHLASYNKIDIKLFFNDINKKYKFDL